MEQLSPISHPLVFVQQAMLHLFLVPAHGHGLVKDLMVEQLFRVAQLEPSMASADLLME